MAFEKLVEAAFGGTVFQAKKRELRLDCELTDEHGVDCRIGISLERDGTSGTWYRGSASTLRTAQQNGYFKHIYPPPVRYERINAKPFIHFQHDPKSANAKRAYSKYARPLWLAIVYQVAETWVVLGDLWLISAVHHIVGIPPPNALVNWAYMTFIWTFTGSNPSVLVIATLIGLCGLDVMTTYPKVDKYFAISGHVAMGSLQKFFEDLSWKNLDRDQLVRQS